MQSLRRSAKGQATVEFALTLPLLLLLLLFITDLGRVLFALSQSADAARQGVRYGIVGGLDKTPTKPQYLDCAGIESSVRSLPGIAAMSSVTITVFYEEEDGTFIANCNNSMTNFDPRPTSDPNYDPHWTGWDGKVLAVRVRGGIAPLTPVVLAMTNEIRFDYTARRTIVAQGTAFTAAWQLPPPPPPVFTATATCRNNVQFTWSALDSTRVNKAIIFDAITRAEVVTITNMNQTTYTCSTCIPNTTDAWSGIYYMTLYNGVSPSVMATNSSNMPSVSCAAVSGGSELSITGKVAQRRSNGNLDNLNGVTVTLTTPGADNTLGTGDDVSYNSSTNSQGTYSFTASGTSNNLTAGRSYRLTVPATYSSRPLESGITNPVTVAIAAGATGAQTGPTFIYQN